MPKLGAIVGEGPKLLADDRVMEPVKIAADVRDVL
jgi:hypothetical protein